MAERGKVYIYELPGGLRAIAGGSRNFVNLDRPWQKEIEVDPENCPFCGQKDQAIWDEEGWGVRESKFTILPFHRMIIPFSCWPANELRNLGGRRKIEIALRMVKTEVDNNIEKRLFLSLHIGALAGQTVSHLHWNVFELMFDEISLGSVSRVKEEMLDFFGKNSNLIVLKNESFVIGAGGLKTGQCFILPVGKRQNADEFAKQLAPLLHNLVSLYNEKFRSQQGLAPDFSLGFYFQEGRKTASFSYGVYTPVLNQWGGAENMMMYENKALFPLRWPHEVTAKHLKGIP